MRFDRRSRVDAIVLWNNLRADGRLAPELSAEEVARETRRGRKQKEAEEAATEAAEAEGCAVAPEAEAATEAEATTPPANPAAVGVGGRGGG